MTTHKVDELEGVQLDAAVTIAEGQQVNRLAGALWSREHDGPVKPYSSTWALAGPIIERERMNFATVGTGPLNANGRRPIVAIPEASAKACEGSTHLIAAMRAYVAAKLGDTVELPA